MASSDNFLFVFSHFCCDENSRTLTVLKEDSDSVAYVDRNLNISERVIDEKLKISDSMYQDSY